MASRVSLPIALALASIVGAADITFTEVFEITGAAAKQERTTSVSGSRVAIDSNDITFIIDPAAKSVTEVDRARAEYSVMPEAMFQERLAIAREDLQTSMEETASPAHWSAVETGFPDPEPGPRLLNVATQWFRWTFKGKAEITGQATTLTPAVTVTIECAIGKPEGWQQIRRLQNVDLRVDALPQARDALDRLAAIEGAMLRCVTRGRTEMPPVPGLDIPAAEEEMRTGIVAIRQQADPALFRIPPDYRVVEFPMTPQRMLTYLALPSALLQ
jgi:hypothetical protein